MGCLLPAAAREFDALHCSFCAADIQWPKQLLQHAAANGLLSSLLWAILLLTDLLLKKITELAFKSRAYSAEAAHTVQTENLFRA